MIRQGLATRAGHKGEGARTSSGWNPGSTLRRPEDHFIDGGDGRLLIAWAARAGQWSPYLAGARWRERRGGVV